MLHSSNPTFPSFVIRRALLPAESLASFVQWHCAENVVPRMADLFRLLTECGGSPVTSIHDLAQSAAALQALERVTRSSTGALDHFRVTTLSSAIDGGKEVRVVHGAYEWPEHSRPRRIQAVCGPCLRDAGFGRVDWEFVQAPVCTRHAVQLLDRCPACSVALGFNRTQLSRCLACAAALDAAAPSAVEEVVVMAARLVQEPRTCAFGTAAYTIPLEPQELSGLLRLMLLPAFGESTEYGLKKGLETLPLARRVQALRRLGSAVVDGRLDADALRSLALARWPYASWLVRDERVRLLREACSDVNLTQDVSAMLCWGTDMPLYPTAGETFGSRMPRILNLAGLAENLNLRLDSLNELLAAEKIKLSKPSDYGYDMDMVLELQRVVCAMPTFQEADALLGWPGVADELVRMRLLTSLSLADGGRAIYPRSVSELLSRIRERVVGVPQADDSHAVSLGLAADFSFDTRRFAWAIAQVVGGSLPAFGWAPPFNLVSLRVCKQRLRALASWPQNETGKAT
jgi:hypothetical protein